MAQLLGLSAEQVARIRPLFPKPQMGMASGGLQQALKHTPGRPTPSKARNTPRWLPP